MSWYPPRPAGPNPPERNGLKNLERVYDGEQQPCGGWVWSEDAQAWMRVEYVGVVDGVPESHVYPPENFRCPVCKWFDDSQHVPGGLNCRAP